MQQYLAISVCCGCHLSCPVLFSCW